MKLNTVVTLSGIISFLTLAIGLLLKIIHISGSNIFLLIGIIGTIIFVPTAIYEVRTSSKINRTEKNLWTLVLIFANGMGSLIYFFVGRKRVV